MAGGRTVNKTEVMELWVIIFFGILATPKYFPQPFNFEVIGAYSMVFLIGYFKCGYRNERPP